MDDEPRVFIIDDDESVLRAIGRLLRTSGFSVEAFASPTDFLARLPYDGAACVLLDLRMPQLSGLDVQEVLAHRNLTMPVVFLSGQGDVPSTARAMREGAVDFLVKPVDENELFDAVSRALARSTELRKRACELRDAADRLERLTKREREVCELVSRGLLNKQIAFELGTSEKTVKVHRGRVMHKLEVDSVAALVRLITRAVKSPHIL
jgi:FixJ family two-component response regulator